jgi:nucleotide-binding universal stress UspA family protein
MKTIIVPVDFSTMSANAAHYACHIASLLQAGVILVHVVVPPVTFSEVPVPNDAFGQMVTEAREEINRLKDTLFQFMNKEVPVSAKVLIGSFFQEIKAFAAEHQPFALVMATQGAGAVEAFVLGSYTFAVADHLDWPLIIVPPHAGFSKIKKLALACDMKDVPATLPVKGINSLFEHLDASLDICYISRPGARDFAEVFEESTSVLNHLSGFHPEIRIKTHKYVNEGIAEFVRENDIDLLLLIGKEHRFPASVFHQSVSRKVMLHSEVPVMLLHA